MLAMDDGALFAFPCYDSTQTDPRSHIKGPHSLINSAHINPVPFSIDVFKDPKSYSASSSCFSAFEVASPILVCDAPRMFENEFHIMECEGSGVAMYSNRHRGSVSSSSGSSLSVPDSPVGSLRPAPLMETEKPSLGSSGEGDDAPWNLVSYHIPWGSAYEGYKSGTLPGPDGPCIFLRSPTPSKKQRTSQACEKCRERKAKCSGTRPVCARCDARGHICVYTSVPSPQGQDGFPDASSVIPSQSFERLSEQLRLDGTSLSHMPRKDSLPESDTSISSDETREGGAGVEDNFPDGPESDTVGSGPASKGSCWSPTLSVLPLVSFTTPIATGSFRDVYPAPPAFSAPSRGSTHAFSNSNGAADPLYTDSRSGLEEYRFPPASTAPGDKAFDFVQNQPLALTSELLSQLPNPHAGNEMAYGNLNWLCGGPESTWASAPSAPDLEMDLEFSEPLPTAQTKSLSSSAATYPGQGGTPTDYDPNSHSSCAFVAENQFLGAEFTGLGQSGTYGNRNTYDIGWIPSDKS